MGKCSLYRTGCDWQGFRRLHRLGPRSTLETWWLSSDPVILSSRAQSLPSHPVPTCSMSHHPAPVWTSPFLVLDYEVQLFALCHSVREICSHNEKIRLFVGRVIFPWHNIKDKAVKQSFLSLLTQMYTAVKSGGFVSLWGKCDYFITCCGV